MQFYIDGQWVDPVEPGETIAVVDPATEDEVALVAAATAADVESAVAAAHRAFENYSQTTREERIEFLTRLREAYKRRIPEIAAAMTTEVGIPRGLAEGGQVLAGARHLKEAMEALRDYPLHEDWGSTRIVREPVGVCALLAPWNWPMNQVTAKVGPALAAGCTMVLKPSEVSPLSALIIAEVLHDAGVPAGVFNLVNGDGATAGRALAAHPGVDMVSFTGSTRAGIAVAHAAADTVKRVAQELGGKSANILLPDADFERAVNLGVARCFNNSGQSCVSPIQRPSTSRFNSTLNVTFGQYPEPPLRLRLRRWRRSRLVERCDVEPLSDDAAAVAVTHLLACHAGAAEWPPAHAAGRRRSSCLSLRSQGDREPTLPSRCRCLC